MAILNSCCCCRSVRRGSYACAIYSLVYYLILAVTLWQYPQTQNNEKEEEEHESVLMDREQYHHHFSVIDYLKKVMLTLSVAGPLTCVLLFIGLCYDIKNLLLPWLVDAVLIILLDLVFVAYIVYQERRNMNPVVALMFTIDFFFLALNIYTVLCVVSQYQEYLDGRGRASDDGSRSPPTIRYCRQSTMNSGLESTRRTVTFLEHGVLINGLSTSSHVRRTPSIVHKEELTIDNNTTHNGNSALTTPDPEEPKVTKSHKKHVQFP
ncbi:uncharacterized protein LOC135222196 [Macrobrachium nipponense]|uniref:uncharacterized protein LOC135222196 n=1 Tax=Macrobrachium nipponense TaxID=159736 RepID=UPI0030C85638